jgi:integrase
MLDRGIPITMVASILGHANTSTTLSVYAHAIKGSEQAGATALDAILARGRSATAELRRAVQRWNALAK